MPDVVKKLVLAYSGRLDTSVILRWRQETYRCEVVTFTADLGQGEELEPARRKAEEPARSLSTICAKSSCATLFSRCFAPMCSMRAPTCSAPRSRVR
jgi:argininosuccinate synthase